MLWRWRCVESEYTGPRRVVSEGQATGNARMERMNAASSFNHKSLLARGIVSPRPGPRPQSKHAAHTPGAPPTPPRSPLPVRDRLSSHVRANGTSNIVSPLVAAASAAPGHRHIALACYSSLAPSSACDTSLACAPISHASPRCTAAHPWYIPGDPIISSRAPLSRPLAIQLIRSIHRTTSLMAL